VFVNVTALKNIVYSANEVAQHYMLLYSMQAIDDNTAVVRGRVCFILFVQYIGMAPKPHHLGWRDSVAIWDHNVIVIALRIEVAENFSQC
jgi:hypothetical protein